MPEVDKGSNPHLKFRPVLVFWALVVALFTALLFFVIGMNYADDKSTSSTQTDTDIISPDASETTTASASASAITDVTANWKTYTNDSQGYTFKYPNDWTLAEGSWPNTLVSQGLDTPKQKEAGKCREDGCDLTNSMRIGLFESANKIDQNSNSLRDYLSKNSGGSDKKFSSYEEVEIGAYSGFKAMAGTNTFGGGLYYYLADAKSRVYEFWFLDAENVIPTISNQILSTFKFSK